MLPIQLFVIGTLVLPALPGEPTTVSGYRLEATLRKALPELPIRAMAVVGYANAYSGYITTYEEYQAQCYEGGSTLFGPWTFAGYQTRFVRLAKRLTDVQAPLGSDVGEPPLHASAGELAARVINPQVRH